MSEELKDWADGVLAAVQGLEQAGQRLAELGSSPPPGGEPEGRLCVFNDLFRALNVQRAGYDGTDRRAAEMLARCPHVSELAASCLRRALVGALDEAARLLEGGARDEARPVLLAGEFGAALMMSRDGDGPKVLFGPVAALPAGHFARELLPEGDLYQVNGRPCLVLGLNSQKFFDAPAVAVLTRDWRRAQLREEDERRQVTEQDDRRAREHYHQQPETRLRTVEAELAELRRQMAGGQAPG
jgi:hypothetical protein